MPGSLCQSGGRKSRYLLPHSLFLIMEILFPWASNIDSPLSVKEWWGQAFQKSSFPVTTHNCINNQGGKSISWNTINCKWDETATLPILIISKTTPHEYTPCWPHAHFWQLHKKLLPSKIKVPPSLLEPLSNIIISLWKKGNHYVCIHGNTISSRKT